MASAVRLEQHAAPEQNLAAWLTFYRTATPGLVSAGNCSVRLDLDNMPQPDLLLIIPEQAGGQSHVSADGYLEGSPELIVEVAASTVSYDLHDKLAAYRRNGVREYIVLRTEDGELDWFVLESCRYVRQEPDEHGRLASFVFPGLRLDVQALMKGDLRAMQEVVEEACRGPGHAAFAARVAPAE